MKINKSRFVFILAVALMLVASLPLLALAEDTEEYVPTLYATFWGLVPPIIAIGLALITKEVYSSLFTGILVGGVLWSIGLGSGKAVFWGIFTHVMTDGIVANAGDPYDMGILVFLICLGWLVAMMNKTGASAAFGVWAQDRIKTREGAELMTVLLGCLIFVDDYFNCLTVGAVMRPITDKHKISRAKLAYLIDATAAPVCIIAPISSWAAAVTGFVPNEDGFSLFIRCIPYNFYALLTIFFMVSITLLKFDYGLMRIHEDNAINGDLYTTPDRPYENAEDDSIQGKGKVSDMVVPVVALIVLCVVGLLYAGGFFDGTGFIEAFSSTDASIGLSIGGLFAMFFALAWYMGRRILTLTEAMDAFPEGFKNMVPAVMILVMAWTLKSMTDSLGAAEFVANLVRQSAGSLLNFLPFIVFIIGCLLSFATGTSWGTFGILIPIVVPIFDGVDEKMLVLSMAACMSGAVVGDHCSPISDTTIMASAGAQSNHINHVNTQLPYVVTVAGVSAVSYILAGFVKNVFIALPFAFVLMIVVLILLRMKYGKEAE